MLGRRIAASSCEKDTDEAFVLLLAGDVIIDRAMDRSPMEQQQQQQQQQQSAPEASASSIAPSFEQQLRSEVSRGCQQVRQFEEKLPTLIQSPALYPALIVDAASIISTFASVIVQLNRGDHKQAIASAAAAAISASPLLPTPTIRPSIQLPTAAATNASSAASSPMACSPIRAPTPPHSPPNLASPHSSPAMTPSTTPEGSPNNPPSTMALDGGAAIDLVGGAATAVEEFPASGSGRKRKCLPKRVVRQPASSNEHGGESPADDGFTWRKYGQKDILNSRFPRSYYRCTHQKELGCQATKYVQKCEDEPSTFQVTYIGDHSCQALQAGGFWMRPSARPLLENPSSTASSVALPTSGSLFASSASAFSTRHEEMKLTLSPSRPAYNNIFRPTTLTSPSQWMTPRFGAVTCPVKAEPLAAPSKLATTLLQRESPASSLDNDKRLLRMSLESGSSSVMAGPSMSSPSTPAASSSPAPIVSAATAAAAAASAATTGEHENIQGLWNLEELPEFMSQKGATLDDIHEIMGYEEPMLFESDQ